jgi:hypothetical protein
MKQILLVAIVAIGFGAMLSCNQAANAPIGADLDKKIDSIKQARLEKMTSDMDSICKMKMKTVVMEKADSIAKAMKETKHS